MDLLPSEDQRDLIAAATDFLESRMPIEGIRARDGQPSAVDRDAWLEGAELGLLTLGLPEEYGGSGRLLDDEALLFATLAEHLATGPFLTSSLAARVAAQCGDLDLVGRISDGSVLVGLAELRGDGSIGPEGIKGTFDLIDCAGVSHVLLVTELGAAIVDLDEFPDVETLDSSDPGIRLATSTVTAATVRHWLPSGTDPIWLRATVLSAAGLAGLANAVTRLATEHAKLRVQFGRPIGVHQAIKHACADMAVASDAAMSQTLFAAVCVQSGRQDALFHALAAKTVASRAAIANAGATIQVHGGMGYTYEHNAHLYLKRAHVISHLFGEPTQVLADLLEQGAPQ
ncbi:acyl-CoA dehydrogenase [Nocardioides immobilis]|uniref:Acyl-CoA dehydrogenase n=1 Tax=Nocardioides immobilis TaxID=2049295 RepID=A0A417Y7B6_9ACTN|nr:acyl-CoA dehydrogenase family protein [Nocardioides immobilis]RHW28583.1 acyl-CoA dehydrogenase [Nocardioides immobilis]